MNLKITNTPIPENGIKCWKCDDSVFQVLTPYGADYHTCPICAEPDISNTDDMTYDEWFSWHDPKGDCDYDFNYCNKCNILFSTGCIHAENGCTDGIYYGSLVSSWEYENKIYYGMPKFKSFRDCYNLISKLKLTWICMCTKIGGCQPCRKAMKTHPHYYVCECIKETNNDLINIVEKYI